MLQPRTLYAKSGEVNIAYQTVGEGPFDLVFVPGWVSNIEYSWEVPPMARCLQRLASFSRLILFDKRGTGLSDRVDDASLPTLEQRMDDLRAVLDAVGSERAAIFGASEGGSMSILFAATHPERTRALIVFGSFAKRIWAPDYPWAPTQQNRAEFFELIEKDWGGNVDLATLAPTASKDEHFARDWATYLRRSASPGAALALAKMNTSVDIRNVLPSVHVPTLILHRGGDLDANVAEGRYLAEHIPGAKFVELRGDDHLWYAGDTERLLDEIEEFLTGTRHAHEPDRVLATVLFTDIVDSTERLAKVGDVMWRDVLDRYRSLVRRELDYFRGREVKSTGDGILATFDGPARAIRCACALRDVARSLGVETRAGLHTGECELLDDGDVGGIAVHIAARVLSTAQPGDVVVSSTLRDLVAGSGLTFQDRGQHQLKGVPGSWDLLAVV